MKAPLFAPLILVAACSGTQTAGPTGSTGTNVLSIGAVLPLPDNSLTKVGGTPTTVQEHLGAKGTLVVFTCNHCPWVKAWEERMVALGNTYLERGVGVIAISPNDPKEFPDDDLTAMEERAHRLGMKYPYAIDASGDVTRAYGATKTPEVFLFGPNQRLVYHGAIDDNAYAPDKVEKQWLRDALDALVAGATPKVANTKALGCAIKPPRGAS